MTKKKLKTKALLASKFPPLPKNYFSPDEDEDTHYSNLFKWVLNLEKQRNLRTGGTVSVLEIEFRDASGKNNHELDFNGVWDNLLELVVSHIRNSDIFFTIAGKIKLILTNSSADGAQTASKRIYRIILNLLSEEKKFERKNLELLIQANIWEYSSKTEHTIVIHDNKIKGETCSPITMET